MYLDRKFGLNLSLSEITLLYDLSLYLDRTLAQRKAKSKVKVVQWLQFCNHWGQSICWWNISKIRSVCHWRDQRNIWALCFQQPRSARKWNIWILRYVLKSCKYCDNCIESLLRDRIVLGIRDASTQKLLLREREREILRWTRPSTFVKQQRVQLHKRKFSDLKQ